MEVVEEVVEVKEDEVEVEEDEVEVEVNQEDYLQRIVVRVNQEECDVN